MRRLMLVLAMVPLLLAAGAESKVTVKVSDELLQEAKARKLITMIDTNSAEEARDETRRNGRADLTRFPVPLSACLRPTGQDQAWPQARCSYQAQVSDSQELLYVSEL